jgi:hypothetical protein
MSAVSFPSIPKRFAAIFAPVQRRYKDSAEIVTKAPSEDSDSDSSSDGEVEFETGPMSTVRMDPATARAHELALPVLLEPRVMVAPKPVAADVAKLVQFVHFVYTLIDLCLRIDNVVEIVQSITPTTRGYVEIIRMQSLQFGQMMNELRGMKQSAIGQYVTRMLSAAVNVMTMTTGEEYRQEKEFFTHFTQCTYVGVNTSATFDNLVCGTLKLFHLFGHFRQNGETHDLFAFNAQKIAVSYLPTFLGDLNAHINSVVLRDIYRGLNLEMSDEAVIAAIRDDMRL